MNATITAVPGVTAGHATDAEHHTGCTVLRFDGGARGGLFVPGSAPGSREWSVFDPSHVAGEIDALVLAGGSAFGLAAADGVMAALAREDIGFDTGMGKVPIVPAAILFDLHTATRRPTAVDGAVAALTDIRDRISSELVTVGVVKIIGDGTQEGYTAWLIEPYADKPDSTGGSPFTEQQWRQLVAEVDAAGFDVHVHACGERTARTALDAIEAAVAANPPRDRRHTIAHLVYVADPDSGRFADLGVVAQFSANWMSADPDTVENLAARYGRPRQDLLYRIQDVAQAGGRISLGTDWPAAGYFSTYKPLDSIQIGVTRQLIGEPGAAVLAPADQRLSVEQAVHANTLGAAYQIRMDDRVGSLEAGKLADLIVLDRNIFDIDPHDIHRAQVQLTMMNGRVMHEV